MTRFQVFILASILFFASLALIVFALSSNYAVDLVTIGLALAVFRVIVGVMALRRRKKLCRLKHLAKVRA